MNLLHFPGLSPRKFLECFIPGRFFHSAVWIVLLDIGTKGSGPIGAVSEPFLARLSAISLPSTPVCPGTHIRVTLLNFPSLLSACIAFRTSFDSTLTDARALSAAWLSLRM
ncbi:hypothetical protein ABMA27_000431 [Loxostege sticticalis]|uniref:Uncharacterized protein n=1 Tax=Loxostege sticticalis TaxID=481309 RepID=A0ABR3IND4_LOXSC